MNTRYTQTILILLLGAVLAPASAQPVLNADNFPQPLLGETVSIAQYEATDPAAFSSAVTTTGENQTWDISGAEFEEPLTSTFTYVLPPFDGLVGAEVFLQSDPQPNYAYLTVDVVDPDQFPEPVEIAFYQHVNSERIQNHGFATRVDADEDGDPEEVFIILDPPPTEFTFPTEYGDMWTNDYQQVFQAVGIGSFPSSVTETNEVVGWGTLETPMGSVEVLQIREETTISVSGVPTPGITSISFLAPFQEVAGKSQLASLHATATLSQDGTTVSSLSYSTIEVDGGGDPTASEDLSEIPARFGIHQNFPNPFNPSTMIEYSLDQTSDVLMTVHDMLGREVAVVVDGVVSAGRHSVRWNAGNLPSGLYQVRMFKDGEVKARSMVLQK